MGPIREEIDFEAARKDPSCAFGSPAEIVDAPSLTKAQKLELLSIWEQDAVQMQTAATESMTGGEEDRLREIQEAIRNAERISD